MTMETTSLNSGQMNHSHDGMSFISKIATLVIRQASKAVSYLKTRRQQRIDRMAFNNMLNLDADILKDIGVEYDDVRWASKLPISQNAALELDKIARANRIMRF